MSTKTLRKRIAIIAISAVSATGMSLIAIPQASALEYSDIDNSTLWIAGVKSITGDAVTVTPADNANMTGGARQVGLVTVTSTTAAASDSGYYVNTTTDASGINTALVLPNAQM
jgi:hypothetical protein